MTQMCRGGHPDLHIQPLMVVMMTLMVMMMAAVMVVMATMAQMCCSHLDIQSRHSLMDDYEDFFICILFLLQPCRLQLCTFASKNLNQSQLSSSPWFSPDDDQNQRWPFPLWTFAGERFRGTQRGFKQSWDLELVVLFFWSVTDRLKI